MKPVYTILRREFKSYFASPIAYIVLFVFLILSGIFFFLYLQSFVESQFDPRFQFFRERLNLNDFVIRPYFGTVSIILLLMIPLITMRLIAEEKKNFTAQLLFISVGLFASSLTENQIISAVISFGILLIFWIIGASSGDEGSILGYISIINHLDNFTKGVIELKDVVYYLSLIFFGLLLTHVTLESERWR